MESIEGGQEKEILHLFLFMIGWSGWLTGKCLSSSWRKSRPNGVVRESEKVGLNQRILRLLLFFFLAWSLLEGGSGVEGSGCDEVITC